MNSHGLHPWDAKRRTKRRTKIFFKKNPPYKKPNPPPTRK